MCYNLKGMGCYNGLIITEFIFSHFVSLFMDDNDIKEHFWYIELQNRMRQETIINYKCYSFQTYINILRPDFLHLTMIHTTTLTYQLRTSNWWLLTKVVDDFQPLSSRISSRWLSNMSENWWLRFQPNIFKFCQSLCVSRPATSNHWLSHCIYGENVCFVNEKRYSPVSIGNMWMF